MFKKQMEYGEAGDNCGILLRGVKRDDVQRGQVLCKPGSQQVYNKFKAELYCLSKEEGGRHTPFFGNYKPQVFIRTANVTGTVNLPEGTEMVMPGDNAEVEIELQKGCVLEKGQRFALREGGRTVGAGIITKLE